MWPVLPKRERFTSDQLKRFTQTFRSLLRLIAYPESGKFFREAEIKIQGAQKDKDTFKVVIDGRIAAEDIETQIAFVWKTHEGALRVSDVVFDGASLMKDYRNQFSRIIDKHEVAGLLSRLQKRLDKELGTPAATP